MASFTPFSLMLSSRKTQLHQRRHIKWAKVLFMKGPQKGPENLRYSESRLLLWQKKQRTAAELMQGSSLGVLVSTKLLIPWFSASSIEPSESNSKGTACSLSFLLTSYAVLPTWILTSVEPSLRLIKSSTRYPQFAGVLMGILMMVPLKKLRMARETLSLPDILYLQAWRIFFLILSKLMMMPMSSLSLKLSRFTSSSPSKVIMKETIMASSVSTSWNCSAFILI